MKKIGLLLVLACASALAEPLARPSVSGEGCVAGARDKAEVDSQAHYHRGNRRLSRNFYHSLEAKTPPDNSFSQSAQLQPYFTGFCNPAFPSSCPR
jgi:hypothetical protein